MWCWKPARCQFGLIVDQINDTQEIVIKPLAEVLRVVPVFAGATILGDGKVALILDTMGIAQCARVLNDKAGAPVSDVEQASEDKQRHIETVLLVENEATGRLAIPLGQVSRLEQIAVSRIEYAGAMQVVQYRQRIVPLFYLCEYLHERSIGDKSSVNQNEMLQVVLIGEEGSQVGLIGKRDC